MLCQTKKHLHLTFKHLKVAWAGLSTLCRLYILSCSDPDYDLISSVNVCALDMKGTSKCVVCCGEVCYLKGTSDAHFPQVYMIL